MSALSAAHRAFRLVNEVLAFLLEVAALLALAVWGYEWGGRLVVGALIGAVVAGAAAVLWGPSPRRAPATGCRCRPSSR